MGPRTSRNPLAFTSSPVTFITAIVYIGLLTALLYVHHVPPPAPAKAVPRSGINLTEAWADLEYITDGYHPYNSRRNDHVREYLLRRINQILDENNPRPTHRPTFAVGHLAPRFSNSTQVKPVIVFDDMQSNVTFSSGLAFSTEAIYFEGTNIVVYIRGSADGSDDWWSPDFGTSRKSDSTTHRRGVLVNAHYDSVSTGFGATDDGVGVVSVLQLIRYFTTPGNRPKRGIVALLNNGEEDYLNGAKAFTQQPISQFPDTFLNLEGAGAGGRATLFRSTDAEVTSFYKDSPYPFGTVVSADGFKQGLVRSATDYSIFTADLGMRGLDVAFMEPRARYHTSEDSARRTSKDSLWHMLSAAMTTTEGLASDTKTDFSSNDGSRAVWFDLLGRIFGLVRLHTMFAISVSLLVVAPVVLIALTAILRATDRYYLFATSQTSDVLDPHAPDEEVYVGFGGWRGVFRYPIAFVAASAATVTLALLITKINPFIIYSSPYSVWSMLLAAWIVTAWFVLRGADYVRPSALHRAHALGWLFAGFWCILVLVTVAENNFDIAGGYFIVIYFASISAALLISYLEFFAVPAKSDYVRITTQAEEDFRPASISGRSGRPISVYSNLDGRPASSRRRGSDDVDANETTSLLGRRTRPSTQSRRKKRAVGSVRDFDVSLVGLKPAFGDEQAWSGPLPSWLWSVQFLILAPINIILVGQVALFITSALHQTLADGSSAMTVYLILAILSILLAVPISPFIHRISSLVPTMLFLVFVGTLIYNLLAFPFSEQNRLKVFFLQQVDLDTGINRVSLTGLDGYIQDIIAALPSAQGQSIHCDDPAITSRRGLKTCSWNGIAPSVVSSTSSTVGDAALGTLEWQYQSWMNITTTVSNSHDKEAELVIKGQNTRACKLLFDTPIFDYNVRGAAPQDPRFPKLPEDGANELRLWHREWSMPWTVNVRWASIAASKTVASLEGRAVCLWSDDNERGAIMALDEVRRYLPVWAAVTKFSDGLVEGSKRFSI